MELSTDEDIKNKQIFKYLHDHNIIPDYDKIDQDLGYSRKYTYKFANIDISNKNYMKKYHALALEACYNIPRNIFFNEYIKEYKDIEEYIKEYRKENNFLVEMQSLEALQELKKFKYLYNLNENNTIIKKRVLSIKNQQISISRLEDDRKTYEGYINISSTSITIVTHNLITGNSIILKIMRKYLLWDIVPISYLGHDNLHRQKVGYALCSNKELNDSEIKYYLNVNGKDFSDTEVKILEKIKSYTS